MSIHGVSTYPKPFLQMRQGATAPMVSKIRSGDKHGPAASTYCVSRVNVEFEHGVVQRIAHVNVRVEVSSCILEVDSEVRHQGVRSDLLKKSHRFLVLQNKTRESCKDKVKTFGVTFYQPFLSISMFLACS